jgi:hypothetical protein
MPAAGGIMTALASGMIRRRAFDTGAVDAA